MDEHGVSRRVSTACKHGVGKWATRSEHVHEEGWCAGHVHRAEAYRRSPSSPRR